MAFAMPKRIMFVGVLQGAVGISGATYEKAAK